MQKQKHKPKHKHNRRTKKQEGQLSEQQYLEHRFREHRHRLIQEGLAIPPSPLTQDQLQRFEL